MTKKQMLLQNVVDHFEDLIGRFGEHAVAKLNDEAGYVQPHVYLTFHLIQMLAAGWETDFEELAVVSGASALFAYQPGEFMPKYSHLNVDPDRRIAEATGFGYEWLPFEGAEGAWEIIKESVDSGRPIKGWHWENILFAGYQEAEKPSDRRIFALADGPETYARWMGWAELKEYVELVGGWGVTQFGRFKERVDPKEPEAVAQQVIADLLAWSKEPPQTVRKQFPEAVFGLEGLMRYAETLENQLGIDEVACHGINGQFGVRAATSVYLKRIAETGMLGETVGKYLVDAADAYAAVYEAWRELYALIGHHADEAQRKTTAQRKLAAAAVRKAQGFEEAGLKALAKVLQPV